MAKAINKKKSGEQLSIIEIVRGPISLIPISLTNQSRDIHL